VFAFKTIAEEGWARSGRRRLKLEIDENVNF
jgi:hypothetical protein